MSKLIYLFSIICISLNLGGIVYARNCSHGEHSKYNYKRTVYTANINNHKVICNVVQQNKQGSYTMSNCEDYNTYLNVSNIEMKVMTF